MSKYVQYTKTLGVVLGVVFAGLVLSGCSKSAKYANEVVPQNNASIEFTKSYNEAQSVKITVLDVTYDYMPETFDLENYDPHAEDNQFIRVKTKIENTGSEPYKFYQHQVTLTAGLETEIKTIWRLMKEPDTMESITGDTVFDLEPGDSKEIAFYYEIMGGLFEAPKESFALNYETVSTPLLRKAQE